MKRIEFLKEWWALTCHIKWAHTFICTHSPISFVFYALWNENNWQKKENIFANNVNLTMYWCVEVNSCHRHTTTVIDTAHGDMMCSYSFLDFIFHFIPTQTANEFSYLEAIFAAHICLWVPSFAQKNIGWLALHRHILWQILCTHHKNSVRIKATRKRRTNARLIC